jgi:putative transport protein
MKSPIDDPVLILFLVISIGYALGRINFFGVKFGVTGVLFSGLFFGIWLPELIIPQVISTIGLIIFVYTVGLDAGPGFSHILKTNGKRDSIIGFSVLFLGGLITYAFAKLLTLEKPLTAGLFSGSLTNTPSLAAVQEALRNMGVSEQINVLPVISYSLCYPTGILGVVLSFEIFRRIYRIQIPQREPPIEPVVTCYTVKNPAVVGKCLVDIMKFGHDPRIVVTRIKRGNETFLARGSSILEYDDIVVCVGEPNEVYTGIQIFGAIKDDIEELDRSQFDYRRVFISNPKVVGRTIAQLRLIEKFDTIITRVRREDKDIVASGSTRLESGDRVRIFTLKKNVKAVSQYLGDSVRGTADGDFGAMAFGMALGVIVGLIPIPLFVVESTFKLGFAGGPLIVALILGHIGYTGNIRWRIPVSANLTLREVGLLLFLAGVGLKAGNGYLESVFLYGSTIIISGAIITFTIALTTLYIANRICKVPFDYCMGLVAGIHTQAPCLAYIATLTNSDKPRFAYSSVFPLATITKIIIAQLLLKL